MSDKYLEAAAQKAEEQHEWAGTNQLGWDSYVLNILNAWVGDRELYEKAVHDMNPRYSFAKAQELGWLVRVSVTGNEGLDDENLRTWEEATARDRDDLLDALVGKGEPT